MATYYAIVDRSIHFEENTTGTIEIVGVLKPDPLVADTDEFPYSKRFPMLYVYKALYNLLPGNAGELYEQKYEDALRNAKANIGKEHSLGRIIPMEI